MFYDYKCTSCNHVQEVQHSIKDEPKIYCNECKSICKRLMPNNANFILKGSWSGKNILREKENKK